jgi:hypothetical protein
MERQTDTEIEQHTDKDMKRVRQAKWLEADSHWYGGADKYSIWIRKRIEIWRGRQTKNAKKGQTSCVFRTLQYCTVV